MRSVIFDLDGVLVQTDRYHFQAWKAIADELAIEFNEEINNRLRGVSRAESLEIVLEGYDGVLAAAEKQQLCDKKNAIYVGLLKNMTPENVAIEVRETLETLRATGRQLAVGSSSKNTKLILRQTDLEGYFDAVSDGTNITRSKPDPEVFLKAAEYLHTEPENCVVVEDACAGIDAAAAAGMVGIGIGAAADYSRTQYRLQNFCELLEALKKLD